MRTVDELDDFKARAFQKYVAGCESCNGGQLVDCQCRKKLNFSIAAYEACIPQDFWWIKDEDINNNETAFKTIVKPYTQKLNKALKRGYGLLFFGDNGVGKTYFISYVLSQAIKKGKTAYFTTMPDLDFNIKRGFKDKSIEERLYFMMTSDFVAIDELGKERAKASNQFMDAQVERMMKRRLDDSFPMLIATNMDPGALDKAYGATVASMLAGKFQQIMMEPGDYRNEIHGKMVNDMGYGK